MPKTVVLTGITGFIAKRVALELLEAGHAVRGSLRSRNREGEVRDALRTHLSDPQSLDRLSFVELDLTRDDGWTDAMAGADALVHTASPFPMSQPDDESQIVRPAVDGTLRALKAAEQAGVKRVVLTSSMVAVMHNEAATSRPVTEADWSDPDHPTLNAYGKSKTLAERAAWDFAKAHPDMDLVVINPGLVIGMPMDEHYGTSLQVIERVFGGKDPMLPDISFPVVHLNDVAHLHAMGVESDAMVGHRHLAASEVRSMPEIGQLLAPAYPDRKIPTRTAPKLMLKALSLIDSSIKGVLPTVGIRYAVDNSDTKARTGITFVPADEAILETAGYLAARSG